MSLPANHCLRSATLPLLSLRLALFLLLSLLAPAAAAPSLGPFGSAPVWRGTCPSACKVRDISILGAGERVPALNADLCIRACKARGSAHYSWSQASSVCSCGRCADGYVQMVLGSGVISGSTGTCTVFPGCSRILRKSATSKCPKGATMIVHGGGTTYQCCCQGQTRPVVSWGVLKECNAYGI